MEKKSRTKDMYIDRLVTIFHSEIEFWNKKLYPKKPISFYDIIQEYHKKYSKPNDGLYVPSENYNPFDGCVVVPYVHDVDASKKAKEVKSTLTTTNKNVNAMKRKSNKKTPWQLSQDVPGIRRNDINQRLPLGLGKLPTEDRLRLVPLVPRYVQ